MLVFMYLIYHLAFSGPSLKAMMSFISKGLQLEFTTREL